MLKRESKLYSIVTYKCPRCHHGHLFENKGWSYTKFAAMPKKCSCCGQYYEPEPGFYYGAMYVSYAITTGLTLTMLAVLSFLLEEITLLWFVSSLAGVLLLSFPFIFRMSRSIWINMFIQFDKKKASCASYELNPTGLRRKV